MGPEHKQCFLMMPKDPILVSLEEQFAKIDELNSQLRTIKEMKLPRETEKIIETNIQLKLETIKRDMHQIIESIGLEQEVSP